MNIRNRMAHINRNGNRMTYRIKFTNSKRLTKKNKTINRNNAINTTKMTNRNRLLFDDFEP